MISILIPLSPLLLLMTGMAAVLIPGSNILDIITKGKFNKDEVTCQMIYASILVDRDNWKIDKDMAKYPKEGSSQILISRDDSTDNLYYSMEALNLSRVKITGHFYKVINQEMKRLYVQHKAKYLHRTLFQDQDMNLLLEDYRKK